MIGNILDRLKGRDIWWGPLVVLLLCAVIGFAIYSLKYNRPLSGIELIVGQLLGFATLLLSFRYGSSKGSKDKTDLISNNKNTTP
jgi:hypothetical protein